MKVITKLPILLFIFCQSAALSQGNNLFLSVNKTFYEKGETIHFSVTQSSPACNGVSGTAYVDLLNGALQIIRQEIVKLNDVQTHQQLILTEADSGYYLLRAYTKEQAELQPKTIQYIAVGIGIPSDKQGNGNQQILRLFPEGGNALVNFTNRFAFFLQSNTGQPVQEKLMIKNKAGQLIAVCNTDANGWGKADIPILNNDIVTIQTANGNVLKTINAASDEVSNSGFSLQADVDSGQVNVEIRKAEGENRRKAFLEVVHRNVLLFDASAIFLSDTNIVATSFTAKGYENKLLHLLLKDEEGNIVSQRQMIIPTATTYEEEKRILSEVFCYSAFPAPGSISVNSINDFLISSIPSTEIKTPEAGFSMFFMNKEAAGQILNYSITGGNGTILQMGNATVDKAGVWEINGCSFTGIAHIQFYLDKKRLSSYSKKIFPVAVADSFSLYKKLVPLLPGQADNHNIGNEEIISTGLMQVSNKEKEIEAVTVVGKKSRIVELEEKYIRNGMFRELNSISINVEDDQNAINSILGNYLVRKLPGIQPKPGRFGMVYRNGYLGYYLDEAPVYWDDIRLIPLREIGFIRFFKNPVGSGMAAQLGGQLLKGNSYASGLQGSVAIYTKKFAGETKPENSDNGILVTGYINE